MNRREFETTKTGLIIGGAYISKPPQMSKDQEMHQEALMAYHRKQRSHILGSSRDLRKLCVGRRSVLWKAKRVARDLFAWLRSPRAW